MKNTLIALSALFGAHLTTASAAIVVVAPTATTPGSFEITDDITFTITTPGQALHFVFDNWVATPDDGANSVFFSPSLLISLNGGAALAEPISIYDNLARSVGDMTANDGYIFNNQFVNSSYSLSPGDTLTLKAGAYSLPITSDFNLLTTQTFTGDMFIADGNGNRISDIATTAIPEPSSAALLFGVASAFAMARRRSRNA